MTPNSMFLYIVAVMGLTEFRKEFGDFTSNLPESGFYWIWILELEIGKNKNKKFSFEKPR